VGLQSDIDLSFVSGNERAASSPDARAPRVELPFKTLLAVVL